MITKGQAYTQIEELVQRFREQIHSCKKNDYNETLARRDIIDPLFRSPGWDIDNAQGYAEAYREVIREDKIKIGGATKPLIILSGSLQLLLYWDLSELKVNLL